MATYRFTIEGAIPAEVIEDLAGVSMVAVTTLRVNVIDIAALNGLLTALHQQGLVLLDVRRDLWAVDDGALDVDARWQSAPPSNPGGSTRTSEGRNERQSPHGIQTLEPA
jgi:hypothetical protein